MGKDHLAFDDSFHRADEPAHRCVLREVAAESGLESVVDRSAVIERRDGHQLRLGPSLQDLPSHREAAAVGKADIHQDEVGVLRLEERDRVTPVRDGRAHAHPGVAKRRTDRLSEQDVIINDQDANRGASLRSTGRTIWKSAPGDPGSTQTIPPCSSTTRRVMKSPRPLPRPRREPASPRTNGSKIDSRSSVGMPGPWSRTLSRNLGPSSTIRTTTGLPGSEYATAFRTRFATAARRCVGSTSAIAGRGAITSIEWLVLSFRYGYTAASTSWVTSWELGVRGRLPTAHPRISPMSPTSCSSSRSDNASRASPPEDRAASSSRAALMLRSGPLSSWAVQASPRSISMFRRRSFAVAASRGKTSPSNEPTHRTRGRSSGSP